MAILAVSREYGSGGRDVGRMVAARLGYDYVDKERLFQDLEHSGPRWGKMARELDEVCPTLWERHDWQYRGYLALMESLILDYAARDRVVIIGRGAPLLLYEVPFCLKVRLVAPLEVRVERIMLRESLDREAAMDLIQRVDYDRACYFKANYHTDWDAESLYDLTLNTGSLTYQQAADLLVEALAEKDALATPEARAHLADLALAYRLRARVATDPRVMVPTLSVDLENGHLVVSGIIHSPKEQKILQEIIREVCGTRPVRFAWQRRA
uniref:BON domain-containing protein n=1 Tax=Desulfobacca acetoxidans TaxID=60893 RepID=A0A7C5ETZ2_9BACT